MPPSVTVVGSVNLDLVARCERLPRAGETVTDATFERVPGGKGANQAVACARLGARVRFVGAVGRDAIAEEALAGLREAGVELDVRETDEPTGVALILVDAAGENQIVVAPGANATLGAVQLPESDAVLCQLEIPDEAVVSAWEGATGLFCLNAAPARPVAVDARPHRRQPLRARGTGAARRPRCRDARRGRGDPARGRRRGRARRRRLRSTAVDGTAAGDAFTAALLVSLLEERPREEALQRACAAGAVAASRFGAQPSLPTTDELEAILDR